MTCGTIPSGRSSNGGNSWPNDDELAAASEWLRLADRFYEAATAAGGIAALWATDAVHGHDIFVGATIFPHNIGLGAAHDPELVRRIGEITALEVRVTGLDWVLAPTVAVARDERWGRTYESYSEDPQLVSAYAAAMVTGLQGEPGSAQFLDGAHVLATPKHFLGDGATRGGRDQGDSTVSESELIACRRGRLPRRAARRRADGDGLVLELARGEDARQPCAAHRRAQGPHGVRRTAARRLERARAASRLHPGRVRRSARCRARRAHGAGRLA